MGMCCAFHSVSDANLDKIGANPPLIWRLIAADDPEAYAEALKERSAIGILARLFGRARDEEPVAVPDLELTDAEQVECDVDKSWQGIHYCLNGTAYEAESPMDFMTVGGEMLGDVDVGYGPARAFRSGQVEQIHAHIDGIGVEDLRAKYEPQRMEELDIYPNIWERDAEEGFEYIAQWYLEVKKFIAHCARHRLGMVIYLC